MNIFRAHISPIGNVRRSPFLRGGDRKFSFDPIPHEHVKKSKVFIALEKEKKKLRSGLRTFISRALEHRQTIQLVVAGDT